MTLHRTAAAWLTVLVCGLILAFAGAVPAQASVQACYELATLFKPSDVSIAYSFVKNHGECLAQVEDPTFQTVAGTLSALTLSGALPKGQCTGVLTNLKSPAAQQLLSVANADLLAAYLSCGCAVADSGVTDKLKLLLEDATSCARTFDPTGPIYSGLENAGDTLGFSSLWGTASFAHNANAGVGNGGAPVEAYQLPTCPTGVPILARTTALNGGPLPPGERARSCECPSPTRLYADGKFIDYVFVFKSDMFLCVVCPPGTAMQNGSCSACSNIAIPFGMDVYQPNAIGSACLKTKTYVDQTCKPGDKWNGYFEDKSQCCRPWQGFGPTPHSCTSLCPSGQVYGAGGSCSQCPDDSELRDNACHPCPPGAHSTNGASCAIPFPEKVCQPGEAHPPGDTMVCMVCPIDTQIVGGACQPCTQGAHSPGGTGFCSLPFPSAGCPAGQGFSPGTNTCVPCPPDTQVQGAYCMNCPQGQHSAGGAGLCHPPHPILACPQTHADGTPGDCGRACRGNTVSDPNRPDRCVPCPAGSVANPDHTACRAALSPANGLQNMRQVMPTPVVGPVAPPPGGGG